MATRRSEDDAPRARLFVAMDLPGTARGALARWRDEAFAGDDALRLVDPAALHMTLVFLGHLPENEIPRIAGLMREAMGPSTSAQMPVPVLRALGMKPIPPKRPRLFALDLDDEGRRATLIQTAVADALEAAGLYEPEERPFRPHVTLARVRKGRRPRPPEAPPPPAESWQADAVTLYRSNLSPRGARYEPLERVSLG